MMIQPNPAEKLTALIEELGTVLSPQSIQSDLASRTLMSQDVFCKKEPAAFVVQPETVKQLITLVQISTKHGFAVLPRGGGMSYTQGYVPVQQNSVIVDMSALDQILEINTDDMYVTVQCGCSWEKLHKALAGSGFRTPFWGTLSGRFATVGGGLSQNSIFWGSGQHGFAVDSVLSVEVVLANGHVIRTGSAGQLHASPFARHFGPDLTGLFCCDNSALGIKATATLRLIPELKFHDGLSFSATSFAALSHLMSEASRQGLISECFGFDPFLQAQRMQRESLGKDVKSLLGVMKSAGSLGKAIKSGTKVALAGRNFVQAESWSAHFMVEDRTEAGIQHKLQAIKAIASKLDVKAIENSIPKILRANPFGPVNNMIGPQGERWVPVHAVVPHSQTQQAYQITEQVFSENHDLIEKFSIGIGYLVATVSSTAFVLEPVFFWPDELNELHKHAVEASHLKRLKGFAANPEATKAIEKIRADLVLAYSQQGFIHMQIGKSYRFKEGLAAENFELLRAIKSYLDPTNSMNPGCLGF
ncbi:MAG: FAD-binding oxidoreductase [Alkalimonas sp.]|nr:FAD-binding oxidoreductase [Alkalimonas sp.]